MRCLEEQSCQPTVMSNLIEFFREEGTKFSYSSLFKLFLEELHKRENDEGFIKYILAVFSFINP
jgi:hypothetical protein